MTQLTLTIAPTPTKLGIKRCTVCREPYRTHGIELPKYTMNRLLEDVFPEPWGICPKCEKGER